MPSTSYQQQLLTRSVDKMFEEAELSGVLLLAGRKLKEFPAQLALKYEISDIISADLSDNRFMHLPICICEMCSMETLRIRNTGLRSIPSDVQLPQSLTYLDLSGNQLTAVPAALFSVPLQILLLAGNRLEYIPREIRQLSSSLRELDASCNKLKNLPADIALLKSLRVLNVRDNQLTHLPSEFSRLELRMLDISQNELCELPSDLRYMCTLVDLRIDTNPLTMPPAKLCSKGREHAFKWLRVHVGAADIPKAYDHTFKRPTNMNATLRKGQIMEGVSDGRRVERRYRAARFNTVGGSDSGYASTVDENRYSHEFPTTTTSAAGCLFGIDEAYQHSSRSSVGASSTLGFNPSDTVNQTNGCGEPLKEVMHAYAQKVGASGVSSQSCVPYRSSGQQRAAIERALLYSSSSIITSPTTSYLSSISSIAQRPQAIVPPMTATLNNSSATAPYQEPETEKHGSNGGQEDGTPDIRNNNTFGQEQSTNSRQHCTQCSAANHQSTNTSSSGSNDSSSSNNSSSIGLSALDRITTMIDDPQPVAADSDFANSKEIEAIYANAQKLRTLSSTGHSMEPFESQKCLSPVAEDFNSSGNSHHSPTTDSVSAVACIASSTGHVSASGAITRLVAPSVAVSSSVKVPVVAASSGRISSSSKLTSSSHLSASSQHHPSPNRVIAEKRQSVSTRVTTTNRTNGNVLSTKSNTTTTTTPRASRTGLHRSPISHTTVAMTSSHAPGSIVENMRRILENRLNTTLPSERAQLAASLADGVHLCNFANRVRVRAVNSLFTPVSKELPLSLPKCRRNVDSFLAACRRIGVPESSLCSTVDILERRNLLQIARTVLALNKFGLTMNGGTRTAATTTTDLPNQTNV